MKNYLTSISMLLLATLLSGCLADLSTRTLRRDGPEQEATKKGQELLDAAWKAQGMDQLAPFATYSVVAEDHWRGLLGRVGKLWPETRTDLRFDYVPGTFDSRLTFLSGKEEGLVAGLQSWHYYEQSPGEEPVFQDKPNANYRFGLAAIQYFFELPDRIRKAPVISYLGTDTFEGETYDRVFTTWGAAKAHKEHDQYVLWISRSSGLIEMAEFTIRDATLKLPGSSALYGSIRYEDFREVEGVLIPFEHYLFTQSPKKKDKKYLHKLTVASFGFDEVPKSDLYINPGLKALGDEKPAE